MKRLRLSARPDWRSRVEQHGLTWHSEGKQTFWNEETAYVLTLSEIATLRRYSRELASILHQAAGHIVKNGLWRSIGLREHEAKLITASWERGDWSLHGRFDFLLDAGGIPKLLEYNAETALSLVETAVIQKHWLSEVMPHRKQFNELESNLIRGWRKSGFEHVHCAWRPRHPEVEGTIRYMAGLMRKAGVQVTMMALHRMGWHRSENVFVDHEGSPVRCCYKLYPWEWMLREPFAKYVEESGCKFIEPPWRLLLGSKGILCLLYDLFGDHPAILPCSTNPERVRDDYASKPLFGHEGHNVTIHRSGVVAESLAGEYGDEPKVFQAFVDSPRHDGYLAQVGVWMVGDEPSAICIRETTGSIISANSAFVPHIVGDEPVS
jgi:glutathionylspermidine synthase